MDRIGKRPLEGIRVIEVRFAGLAPVGISVSLSQSPDLSFERRLSGSILRVIRVDNPTSVNNPTNDVLCRGKRSIAISPKVPAGLATLLRLISNAHVLIDPFRPGVMENLGLGPEVFLGSQAINPRLVYARLVGFDRHGELKNMAGHDLNYLAHAGVLGMMPPTTPEGRPAFPLNILADMAGGGLICATGIIAALLSLAKDPLAPGKVVETDMVAGSRYIASFNLIHSLIQKDPLFAQPPGRSLLDGGAPFYNSYQCSDGGWMSVACIEPKFFATFCTLIQHHLPSNFNPPMDATRPEPSTQGDRDKWRSHERWITEAFKTRTRKEWEDIFKGTDACVVPVLTPSEAARIHGSSPRFHPNFVGYFGEDRPMNLFTQTNSHGQSLRPGAHTFNILRDIGLNSDQMGELKRQGALGDQADDRAKL
ncbi:CoA-transferase family III [Rhizoctonia solani]|uniref:CoA-transferase family III n=1 Tax=Rhizoctonia solani TaxID=456999 RepID=A0A8H7H670_9AGAM